MLTSPPRQRTSRPSRHGHIFKSPGADERAAVEVKTARIPSIEEAADTPAWPTLDDFGGRSDALGG